MTPLLCVLLMAEINVVMILLFKTPLRKLAMFVLDRLKEGRGPVMSTVGVTLFAVLMSSLYNIMRIQKRSMESGVVDSKDHVLLANHILDASLMGCSLFLGLMIDRLHYYVKRFDDYEHIQTYYKPRKADETTESD